MCPCLLSELLDHRRIGWELEDAESFVGGNREREESSMSRQKFKCLDREVLLGRASDGHGDVGSVLGMVSVMVVAAIVFLIALPPLS